MKTKIDNKIMGRINKNLKIRIRYNGEIMTNKDLYNRLLDNGAKPAEKTKVRYFDKQMGPFHYEAIEKRTTYYVLEKPDMSIVEIPKIIHDHIELVK